MSWGTNIFCLRLPIYNLNIKSDWSLKHYTIRKLDLDVISLHRRDLKIQPNKRRKVIEKDLNFN